MALYVDNFINLSVSLSVATPIPQGLGPAVYVAIEAATPIPNQITQVTSLTDVANLLAGTQISAQAADDLNAMFAQNNPPTSIFVASYIPPETPDAALDRMVSAQNFFGVIAQESRADADNANLGTWVNATTDRRWRRMLVLQTSNADIITSGKPAALSACEFETCLMVAHNDDTEPAAAALAGVLAGHRMTVKPLPLHVQVRSVALTTYTDPQLAFAKGNDACVAIQGGSGASASVFIIDQTRTYGGFEAAAVMSLVYASNRLIAALGDLVVSKAQRQEILRADAAGANEVKGTIDVPLAALANTSPSHFTPGSVGTPPDEIPLPLGFSTTVTPSGTELLAQSILRFGPEATAIGLTLDGIIAQE